MTQEKTRRIVTACVSAATVLLVFLLGFLVYQWISMGITKDKIKDTKAEIARLEQQLSEAKDDEAYLMTNHYLQTQLQKLNLLEGK